MALETRSQQKCFGGEQGYFEHQSRTTGTPMRFSLFLPPRGKRPAPLLWWLSGLTCNEDNFTVKAGAQRLAAELGLAIIAPDTSPRGEVVPDDNAYDLGQGAGFYLDATEDPWAENYSMYSYLRDELPEVVQNNFDLDMERQAIAGHSMGGHGALIMALKNPGRFASVSAFAPIVAPASVPWGEKALAAYLGTDKAKWRAWDACALIEDGARTSPILVDQGSADPFLAEQLQPERLNEACSAAGIDLKLRMQDGYDHSYFFIASFIGDHLRFHMDHLDKVR